MRVTSTILLLLEQAPDSIEDHPAGAVVLRRAGLIATVSSPICAPVIVATRLRKGSANPARRAARLAGDALATARAAGARGPRGDKLIVLRAGSAIYRHRHKADNGYPADRTIAGQRLARDAWPVQGRRVSSAPRGSAESRSWACRGARR